MALLGDIYLFVQQEETESPVQTSEHPVETGVALTDHVLAKPACLRLEGEVVGPDCENTLQTLREWQRIGAAVHYVGRQVFKNAQIVEFSYQYTHRIAGGCSFTMTLREVRVAQNIYTIGLGFSGKMEVRYCNGLGIDRIVDLSSVRERYHTLAPGETVLYLAAQYRSHGVSAESIREQNRTRDVFRAGHKGDFAYLQTGAKLLLGVW